MTGLCPCDFLSGTTVAVAYPGAVLLTQLLPANRSSPAPEDPSFRRCPSGAWSRFLGWQGFQPGVILGVELWILGQLCCSELRVGEGGSPLPPTWANT